MIPWLNSLTPKGELSLSEVSGVANKRQRMGPLTTIAGSKRNLTTPVGGGGMRDELKEHQHKRLDNGVSSKDSKNPRLIYGINRHTNVFNL